MMDADALQRGRDAFSQHAWADACRQLTAADQQAPLGPEDLDRLATAAYLAGRDDESERVRSRAHQQFLQRGEHEAAARAAFWLAFGLLQSGAHAPASGWLARAERVLEDARLECVVRGYLLIPVAIQRIVQGEAAAAHDTFSQASELAAHFADRDLAAFSCHGRGRALIRLGRVREGVARLDEAMTAVVAGDVSPMLAGDIYCSVLEACQEIFDLRRAHEWTASLSRWCAAQPGLIRYRGECLLYRAELSQLRGEWDAAERDASQAYELLSSPRGRGAVGTAHYRLAEIHRLRGHFEKAEAAYREANESGRSPQPGLSLLRLARGQPDAAAAAIRTALPAARQRGTRARMLAAAVDITLAAGDIDSARGDAAELSGIASALGAPYLAAASAYATGAVLLATGDVMAATTSLRDACATWHDLEMPYDEAQARVLLARACHHLGDRDGRQVELDAARTLFKRLGAQPAFGRVVELSDVTPREAAAPLSEREAQVLRLMATGKTNRAIAEELFISEKTVARHVSNIFDKLGVSSRTGATAWAYQRHLI